MRVNRRNSRKIDLEKHLTNNESIGEIMVVIRDWLLDCAITEFFSFDKADFDQEIDEILEGYIEFEDPGQEDAFRNERWLLLQTWQQDREYLSSLDLHRIIARHVRNSCREARAYPCIKSWIELGSASSRLDGSQLASEIENAIRDAWKVRAPWRTDAVPKFSEELSFESLDKFHLGLENIIGYPPTNSDFLDLMKREHEQSETFKDQKGRPVDPKIEWNIVMGSEAWNIAGAGGEPSFEIKKREIGKPLDFYVQKAKAMFSDAWAPGAKNQALAEAEVAALRLWTGPMHKKYAEVLRHPMKPNGPYVTTLHALNSGITKLARIWRIPASRKVCRGYRNLCLKELKKDAFQCVGGVEKSVLATSTNFNIAVQYSEDGAFILEMDVGQVNRGADVSWLSQFPHEREILFNALSNVEFLCSPQLRFVEGRGTILVYQVCVSANVKSKTLEEFVSLRKDLHLNLVDVLTQEVRRMVYLREKGSTHGLIKSLCAECRNQCDCIVKEAGEAAVGIFNKGAPAYLTPVEDAILLQSRALQIIDLAVLWFETREVDLANLKPGRFQSWQLEALRTAFRSGECPQVRTIVLEQARIEESGFFTRESLDLGAHHRPETACRAAELLTLNPNLKYLKMEVVNGTAEVWEQVFKLLCLGRPSLRVNSFFLAEYAAVNTLQHLEFRNLDVLMAAMIAPALQFHAPVALTSLSLRGSPIGCTGAESLGRACGNLQMLRYMDLRSCNIADRGCTGISHGLPALTKLEDLNLAGNHVKDDGFNILTAAIGTSRLSRLKSVDMRWNDSQLPSVRCGSRCIVRNHITMLMLSTDGRVSCVTWSPAGDQLASGSYDNTVIIWDAETGKQISTLKGHSSAVTSVMWCPGGDQIAGGSVDAKIIIWNAKTGDQVSTLKGHTNTVTSVAWRPGGDQIVSGGLGPGGSDRPGEIIIWDAKTGEKISELQGHTKAVTSVAWRPWGDLIASGSYDNKIIVWDVKTSEKILMLKGHTNNVTSVAWHPGGDIIASGSWDKSIIIWDVKTGKTVSAIKGHTDDVNCVAWCLGGDQIVSGGGSPSGEINIWDAKTGDLVKALKGHKAIITSLSVAWRPLGSGDQIASSSTDDKIIIWDAETVEQVSTFKGHTGSVQCVAWHPGGDQIASGSEDKTIIIWDAKTGKQISTLKGTGSVKSVAWRPRDDQFFADGSSDHTITIWDAKTGKQVSTLKGHTAEVTSVAWCPRGDQIVSSASGGEYGKPGEVIIWDATTGETMSELKGHTAAVTSVDWQPGGDQIVSGGYGKSSPYVPGKIIIWDAKTGDAVSTFKGHACAVMSVAWHPGGDYIASGSLDTTIMIWDMKTFSRVLTLRGHAGSVHSVAWRPGGDQIASASLDTTIIIWDAKTGDQVSTLNGHPRQVTSIAWRPGGDKIASGSADNTIIILDAKAISTQHQGIESMTCVKVARTQSRIKPIIPEEAESGAVASTLQLMPLAANTPQGVTWQGNEANCRNESVSADICLHNGDICVDADAACLPPKPKKKKIHCRESQSSLS